MKLPPKGKSLQAMMCWRPAEAPQLRTPRTNSFEYYEINYNHGALSIRTIDSFRLPDDVEMYTDGSCQGSPASNTMASGAAVHLHEGTHESGTYRAIAWTVPADLPQSSFPGEYIGLMLVLTGFPDVTNVPPVNVVTDSAALLNGWARASACGPSFNRRWDGLYKQAIADGKSGASVLSICLHKVKAHREIADAISPQDASWIHGNRVADAVANRIIDNHNYTKAFEAELAALKKHRSFLREVVHKLGEARILASPEPKPKRVMKAWLRASQQAVVKQHQLTWVGSHFACNLCFRRFKSLPSVSVSCGGHPRAGIGAISIATKHQHKPVIAGFTGIKKGFLIACLRCGGFSFDRIDLLAKPCSGHLGPRANTLKRLAKGKHPYCRHSLVTEMWTPFISKLGQPKLARVSDTAEITQFTPQATPPTTQGPHWQDTPPSALPPATIPACPRHPPRRPPDRTRMPKVDRTSGTWRHQHFPHSSRLNKMPARRLNPRMRCQGVLSA